MKKANNVIMLRDYALERLTMVHIKTLSKILGAIIRLQDRCRSAEALKSQSMARIYLTACILELEKVRLADNINTTSK